MPQSGATSRRSDEARPAPLWMPILLALVVGALAFQRLRRDAADHGVGTIDTSRYRLHERGTYSHASWRNHIQRLLARTRGELAVDDHAGIAALQRDLAALSFVAEVGAPEVLWPDGLTVALRFREPVGCARIADAFLPVDADGVVVAGVAAGPHEAYGAWLPVVAWLDDETSSRTRPGDLLVADEQVAALAVARSMWEHLAPEDVRRLGRVVIDASRPTAPDGLPGGVVIDLEGRRRILFGRAPLPTDRVLGELPIHMKWDNVRAALRALDEGSDWVLFDARWDVPEAILGGSEYDRTVVARGADRASGG